MKQDRFEKKRFDMVEHHIKARGIHDERLIHAFLQVKREEFIDHKYHNIAYEDYPITIGHGQTISQPYMVAYMIDKLALRGSDKILEVGTGSGYATAILSHIVAHIYTVERLEVLINHAKHTLDKCGITNVSYLWGDGHDGWMEEAPFDAIIVSAAADTIPQALLEQLSMNGKLIIPIGDRYDQDLILVQKHIDGIKKRLLCGCRFVPLKKSVIKQTEESNE
jgi:protein-L-isoaspartate(D-aspartate) O-methyltransferase